MMYEPIRNISVTQVCELNIFYGTSISLSALISIKYPSTNLVN